VKAIVNNLVLSLALFASVVVHVILLLIHFVMPATPPAKAVDQGLEVILVNARTEKRPNQAQALAQVNLEGGGAHEEGRAKSPLPDMAKIENGEDVLKAKRRIEELEERQKKLIDQVRAERDFRSAQVMDKQKPDDVASKLSGRDRVDSNKIFARTVAEISQRIEDQNKRPKKTVVSPSTHAVAHAQYSMLVQQKIEKIGTLNFPKKDGQKLYGEVIISIPIFQNGAIYEDEGGAKIERSSGNPVLDRAALKILKSAAPFGAFPKDLQLKGNGSVLIFVHVFKFTREEKLETEMRDGNVN
jgi:protein TonB